MRIFVPGDVFPKDFDAGITRPWDLDSGQRKLDLLLVMGISNSFPL